MVCVYTTSHFQKKKKFINQDPTENNRVKVVVLTSSTGRRVSYDYSHFILFSRRLLRFFLFLPYVFSLYVSSYLLYIELQHTLKGTICFVSILGFYSYLGVYDLVVLIGELLVLMESGIFVLLSFLHLPLITSVLKTEPSVTIPNEDGEGFFGSLCLRFPQ